MKKVILGLFIILFCFSIGVANYQEKELSEEEKAILKKAIEIIKKHKERELLELMREASAPKEKKELSWEEKYRMYPSTKYWLNSLKEPDERYLERIEEENDRLEDLLDEIRSERFNLEQDMIGYRWDLELAKPDPFDYKMALDSAIFSTMMDIELGLYPWLTKPSYPRYSTQQDWTNYLWLYLLLGNK